MEGHNKIIVTLFSAILWPGEANFLCFEKEQNDKLSGCTYFIYFYKENLEIFCAMSTFEEFNGCLLGVVQSVYVKSQSLTAKIYKADNEWKELTKL